MTTNIDNKDTSWAIKTFRPLLKALKLQEVKSEPLILLTSTFKIFHRYNMSNCVIIVKIREFTNKDDRGIFIWQYNEENNFYALHIIINKILYNNNDIDTRIKRKATGVHEFTHCVASMMIFSRLQSKILRETLQERMAKKIHSLDRISLELLFKELTMDYEDKKKNNISIFPDDHFRISGDDFTGFYDDLSRNFLLSYELFCEEDFFNTDKQKMFHDYLKHNEKTEAMKLLISVIKPLSEKKALSQHFIIQRINEEFLNKILKK
jgi:hypothetical protein